MAAMKAKELIEALSKMNPESVVIIDVKQSNKRYGRQLTIENSKYGTPGNEYFAWISATYSGATITVHLPEKAIISNWPKETFRPVATVDK